MKRTAVTLIACAAMALLFVVVSHFAKLPSEPPSVPNASTESASSSRHPVGEAASQVQIPSSLPPPESRGELLVLTQDTLPRVREQLSSQSAKLDLVVEGPVVIYRPEEWHARSVKFTQNGAIFVGQNNLKLYVAEVLSVEGNSTSPVIASFEPTMDSAQSGPNGNSGSSAGAAGESGRNGADGLDSGNVDLYLQTPPASIIYIDLAGQSGGRGGNGGNGYPGSRGTPGRNARVGILGCDAGGQNGGEGGTGGNGGDAGAGGKCGASGTLEVHAPRQVLEEIREKSLLRISTRLPRIGESGLPGQGGRGGEGGQGGAGGGFCSGGSMGPHGVEGRNGLPATTREQMQCAPMKMILD